MDMDILMWNHALYVLINMLVVNYKKNIIFSSLRQPWEGYARGEHGLYRKLFENHIKLRFHTKGGGTIAIAHLKGLCSTLKGLRTKGDPTHNQIAYVRRAR